MIFDDWHATPAARTTPMTPWMVTLRNYVINAINDWPLIIGNLSLFFVHPTPRGISKHTSKSDVVKPKP